MGPDDSVQPARANGTAMHPRGRHPHPLARKYGHDVAGSKVLRSKQVERDTGVAASKAGVRKEIRDLRRLLARANNTAHATDTTLFPSTDANAGVMSADRQASIAQNPTGKVLPATKIRELERKLEFLTAQLGTKDQEALERKYWEKYKYVRFVEQKKVRRRMGQLERRIERLIDEVRLEEAEEAHSDSSSDTDDEDTNSESDESDNESDVSQDDDDNSSSSGESADGSTKMDDTSDNEDDNDDGSADAGTKEDIAAEKQRSLLSKKKLLLAALQRCMLGLKVKLAYTKHYPRDMKYMSLFAKSANGMSDDMLPGDSSSSINSEISSLDDQRTDPNLAEFLNPTLPESEKESQLKIFERLLVAVKSGEVERPAFVLRRRNVFT